MLVKLHEVFCHALKPPYSALECFHVGRLRSFLETLSPNTPRVILHYPAESVTFHCPAPSRTALCESSFSLALDTYVTLGRFM